ncbi:unnamed protein product [Echinostoma caproni]|uniref:Retrotrans_gag domain-containing protein n=1 Tax=Echinostoma caproni TaxID=27848 RepID=A0A183A2F3_9TREM|nr:unnamed protein product [Echinostoma caproni]
MENAKRAYFLTVIGKDAYSLLKNLESPDSPISFSYESLETLFLKHLQPDNFEAAERAKFHSLTCGGSQHVRDFILQLKTQASRCKFGDQLQTQLRDRLIAAIPNSHHPDESGFSKRARKHQATSVLRPTMTNGFKDGTSAIPVVKDIRGYPVNFEMPSVTIAVSLAISNLSAKVRSRVLPNVRRPFL